MHAIIKVRQCDQYRPASALHKEKNNEGKGLRAQTSVNVSANNKCMKAGEMNRV